MNLDFHRVIGIQRGVMLIKSSVLLLTQYKHSMCVAIFFSTKTFPFLFILPDEHILVSSYLLKFSAIASQLGSLITTFVCYDIVTTKDLA